MGEKLQPEHFELVEENNCFNLKDSLIIRWSKLKLFHFDFEGAICLHPGGSNLELSHIVKQVQAKLKTFSVSGKQ